MLEGFRSLRSEIIDSILSKVRTSALHRNPMSAASDEQEVLRYHERQLLVLVIGLVLMANLSYRALCS